MESLKVPSNNKALGAYIRNSQGAREAFGGCRPSPAEAAVYMHFLSLIKDSHTKITLKVYSGYMILWPCWGRQCRSLSSCGTASHDPTLKSLRHCTVLQALTSRILGGRNLEPFRSGRDFLGDCHRASEASARLRLGCMAPRSSETPHFRTVP